MEFQRLSEAYPPTSQNNFEYKSTIHETLSDSMFKL